jgi:hypothetical protein
MLKTLPLILAATFCAQAQNLTLSWTNNMLRISGPNIPGDYVEIWYLEAFCRSGSTDREWDRTTIPHKTELLKATPHALSLRTRVEPEVILEHEIIARADEVEFRVLATNSGKGFVDVQWFQPCMRVDRFTGANQSNYISKSFIFTKDGLRLLDQLPRNEAAIYRGGQVYVPPTVPLADVNPRPISDIPPVNGLIGCYSKDGSQILATAWSSTQELFQGVIVCLHSDPRIGGLRGNESKTLRGKVYFRPNDPKELLRRYRQDFPDQQN